MYANANGLVDHPYGLDIQDVEDIEAKLGYQIVIYRNAEKTPMHWDHRYDELPKIYILYNSEIHHFSLIKHIRAFFGNKYFCERCMKIYSTVNSHRCPATCTSCFRMNCEESTTTSETCVCGVKLNNERCSFYHAQVCKVARRCPTCTNIMPFRHKHVCYDQKYCSNCDEVVELDHRCYIKKLDRDSKVKFNGVGFFDFETYELENGTHVVNLAIAKRYCKVCYYEEAQQCKLCEKNYTFYNISDFVAWLKAYANKSFIWYAHNSRAFDTQFILNELYKTALPTDPQINVITNGTKIMELKCAGFIIRDSACFIPMPLSQFPAAFGIKELKKGYFPYKFCKPENFNYVGPYPDASYYQPEYMTRENKQDFEQFYKVMTNRNTVFDFKAEYEAYCLSDVLLLAAGCLTFAKLYRENSLIDGVGFDPLVNCLTLASACNALFRRNYMPENMIATLPHSGFDPKSNMSRECTLWLRYYSERNNIHSKSKHYPNPFFILYPNCSSFF